MTAKQTYTILDETAALLERYSTAFPAPDDVIGQPEHLTILLLWLARDHGLRTIRGMSHLLQDDENNAVLACTLLRPFYELSVRLLWASREADGWRRLFTYYVKENKKSAIKAKNFQNPRIVKIANEEMQSIQEIESWRDADGNSIKPAPDMRQILLDIENYEAQNSSTTSQDNWGQIYYTILYQILCRASHAHIETITGERYNMYLYIAGAGSEKATVNLLQAFIHQTQQPLKDDIDKEVLSLLQRCRQL